MLEFTQSATKDGGALASWRMEAPPSDCGNSNIAIRTQGSKNSYIYSSLTSVTSSLTTVDNPARTCKSDGMTIFVDLPSATVASVS